MYPLQIAKRNTKRGAMLSVLMESVNDRSVEALPALSSTAAKDTSDTIN
jgi:hypothetical protein